MDSRRNRLVIATLCCKIVTDLLMLLFHALGQLLSMSSSNETHSALYIATFRAITSDWREYKHSLGTSTQNVLLDMVVPGRDVVGFLSSNDCPVYIENEFLVLLGWQHPRRTDGSTYQRRRAGYYQLLRLLFFFTPHSCVVPQGVGSHRVITRARGSSL